MRSQEDREFTLDGSKEETFLRTTCRIGEQIREDDARID